LFNWDFKAESIAQTMVENRQMIVSKIGEQKYNNELALMQQIGNDDEDGVFKTYSIDQRNQDLKDKDLAKGYNEQVGIDGCRMSID